MKNKRLNSNTDELQNEAVSEAIIEEHKEQTAQADAQRRVDTLGQIRTEAQEGVEIQGKVAEKGENLDQIRDEVATGTEIQEKLQRNEPISAEEARALLAHEKRLTDENMRKTNQKSLRLILIVIVMAIVFCVVAAVCMLLIGDTKRGEVVDNGAKDAINSTEPKEDEKHDENELMEVGLDDEDVQELYGVFRNFGMGFSSFLSEELKLGDNVSNTDKPWRVEAAMQAIGITACRASIDNGGLVARYGEHILNWSDSQKKEVESCYDGTAVRQKYEELFGELAPEFHGEDYFQIVDDINWKDVYWPSFVAKYSPTYDEFYNMLGGAGSPSGRVRELERAEKDDERMYLYELIANFTCGPHEDENAELIDDKTVCSVSGFNEEPYKWFSNDYFPDSEDVLKIAKEHGLGKVKWTFVKNAEGNYIFESLTKVEDKNE